MQILRRECFSSGIGLFDLPSVFANGEDPKSADELFDRETNVPNVPSTNINHLSLTPPPVELDVPKKKRPKLRAVKSVVIKSPPVTLPKHTRQLQPTHEHQLKSVHKRHNQSELKWYMINTDNLHPIRKFLRHAHLLLSLCSSAAKGNLSKTTCYFDLEMAQSGKPRTRLGNFLFVYLF